MSKKLTYEELEPHVRELAASQRLREQNSLDHLIESIQAGIVVHGSDGAVIKSNTVAEEMLGLTHEQMLGKELIDPAWTFLREDGSPMPVEEYPVSRVLATQKPVHDLVAGIRRSGKAEPIWVLDTAIPKFDENGHIGQIVTTFMDIGALKNSEEKYRNLFEHTINEVHLWKLVRDENGSIKTWRLMEINPAALKAWGKTRPEIIGKTTNEIFSYDTTEHFMPIVKKIFSEGTPQTWETYFPPTNQFLYMTSVPFGEYFISTGTDITERKQTEEALRESEERHRLFYNPSFGGSIIHDKGVIIDCSKGIANITGYSHDELIGMDGLLLIAPDWRDFAMDKIASEFEEPYEAEGIRKDGKIFPLRIHAKTIQYRGKPARVVEFRDISEIKKKEEALKKSEAFLDETGKIAKVGGWNYDIQKEKLIWTKELYNIHEVASDFVLTVEKGWEFYHPDSKKALKKAYDDAVANGVSYDLELIIITEKNNEKYVKVIGRPKKNENGKVVSVGGIFQDITEKKKAEQALKTSEERLRTLVNTNPFPIVVIDPEQEKILFWSKSAKELFGHEPKTPAEWFSLAYPDPLYRQAVIDRSKPYLERVKHLKTAVNTGEYEIVCGDGSVRICEIYAQYIPGQLVLTNNDITERKKAEEEIRAAREFLDKVIDSSMFGMWVSDKEGTVIRANRSICETLNLAEDRIVGQYNVFKDDNLKTQGVMPMVKSVFEKFQPARFSIPWRAAEAEVVDFQGAPDLYVDVYMFPILDAKGNLKNVVCQWLDITERKQTEMALQKSEKLLSQAEEIADMGSWEWNIETDIAYWSDGLFRIFKRSPNEGAPKWGEQSGFYQKESYEKLSGAVEACVKKGTPYDVTVQAIRSDGEIRTCVSRGRGEKNHEGKICRLRGTFEDITERARTEQALKESENLLRNIIDTSTDYIFVKDMDLKTLLCNEKFAQAVGKNPADLIGKTDIENGWDAELVKGNPEKGIAGYENDDLEALSGKIVRTTDKATVSGRSLFLDTIKIPLKDENDKIFGMLGIGRDITERKRLESDKDCLIADLKEALARVKKLEGFLPICSFCKKIRDDQGDWQQMEVYIRDRSEAEFSHSICPKCLKENYPGLYPDTDDD
jgi:PAS domain S-box-containing protein